MKNNIKKLIASVVVLVLFAGAYFIVNKMPSEDDNKGSQNTAEEKKQQSTDSNNAQTSEGDYLINEKTDDVSSIVFSTGEITYTIHNGDNPVIEGYSSHVIDKSQLVMALFNGTLVFSGGVVDGADDLSKYGLDNENKYMIVKLKNGKERKIIIGNPTYVNGEYYAKMSDSDVVHIISESTASNILKHPDEYRSLDVAEIDNYTASEFSISKGDEKVLEVKYTYTRAENEQMHVYKMLYPYDNVEANLDAINLFYQTLSSVYAYEIVEENPADLSKYGLDNPYSLTIKDEKRTSVIKMGNYAENGAVYVMKGDIPVVYKANCSFYESVKNINPEDYVSRFIHLFYIKDVSGVIVKNSEKTYNMVITKKSDDKYDYKINDKIKVKETFSPIYTEIIGVTAKSFGEYDLQGEEKCSITFKFNDNSSKTFTYYNYDERQCVVKADNGLTCLVTTDSLDKIFAALEK